MLFNSISFLFFLPIVFLVYWFACPTRKIQNMFLVVASYVFYGWWDWRFLMLIAFTSICSFSSGLLIDYYSKDRNCQRIVSGMNILVNLLILGVFKYYNFFMNSIETLFCDFGYQMDWVTLDVILPVGISFYTFQALSYTIDVYRGDIRPTRDVIEFFAYISFFPQLVAGPIERATNLLPQFQRSRMFEYASAVDGMRQMLWGFYKKLVIADNCGSIVNLYWDSYTDLSGVNILALGVLFTFQIYCDFSGYSDIAIGCARIFGIRLMQNFNYPYFSSSIPEFWRRWHISLMSWFRDYVYFPLGGSKCVRWKAYMNVLIVFSISGLWHGANWTFVIWGLYNGLLIVFWRLSGIHVITNRNGMMKGKLSKLKENGLIFLTFLLVVIGFMIFRSEDITQAYDILSKMFMTMFDGSHLEFGKRVFVFGIFPLIFAEYIQRTKAHVLQFPDNRFFSHKTVRWAVYVLLFSIIFVFSFTGESQEFIYFQF